MYLSYMKNPRELLHQTPLPELARFSEPQTEPGEETDIALATTHFPIHLLATPESADAARAYRYIIGRDITEFRISIDENPIERALAKPNDDEIKLVMHSATDRVLFQRMFADGPKLGQLLMSHVYVLSENHESPTIHCIGATTHSLNLLSDSHGGKDASIIDRIAERRRNLLRDSLTNIDFREILKSNSVRRVIAHALGPVGTNISQAMRQYIESLGIQDKTDLVVHPGGVEPLTYAEFAALQVEDGVIPIHMECAVYYEMAKLFAERPNEVVFADHHYMLLDTMQLASVKPIEEIASSGVMRIAAHPSPRPLIDPWVNAGRAEWVKATSNSQAAQMALDPTSGIDACITTGSGLENAPGLQSRHIFGRPNMLFTIATPLSQSQLRQYM
jgi:hypothetical protein